MTGFTGRGWDAGRTRVALASLLAVAVLVGALGGASAAPRPSGSASAGAAISASSFCPDAEELAFLTKINDYRRQNGRGALTLTKTLGAAAEHHSREMAKNNYFSHTLSGGVSWSQNIVNHGYNFNTYKGENIAAGNSSAASTFTQWVNSSAHRANMLSSNYTAIGIGRSYNSGSTYKWYWTTTFGGQTDAAVSC